MKEKVLFAELSYTIVGILFEAHNALGRFAREVQYANFIEEQLKQRGMMYRRERDIPFSGSTATIRGNRIDFLIDGKVLLELKAKPCLERTDFVQTHRYLEASRAPLGMLVNFRERYLRPRRIVLKQTIRDISDHS